MGRARTGIPGCACDPALDDWSRLVWIGKVFGEIEITDLNQDIPPTILCDQDIFWFYVSMKETLIVDIFYSIQYLVKDYK